MLGGGRDLTCPNVRDGTGLVTLRDAASALLDVFGSANARSGVPDNATRLLLIAAKTGKRPDIAAATAAVEGVLTVAGRIR